MIVQGVEQHLQNRWTQPRFDLGAVAGEDVEVERQEVVGDAVEAPPGSPRLGDRLDTLDQPEDDQASSRRVGSARITSLISWWRVLPVAIACSTASVS